MWGYGFTSIKFTFIDDGKKNKKGEKINVYAANSMNFNGDINVGVEMLIKY